MKERSRSNNVDLTCTLPEDETPNEPTEELPRVGEQSVFGGSSAAGHKVRQSAAACGERRQCAKPPARKSVRKLILLVVSGYRSYCYWLVAW